MDNLKTLSPKLIRIALEDQAGTFITIEGFKKDGSHAVYNGKLKESPPSHKDKPNLITVQRMNKEKRYASIDINKITRVKYRGNELKAS